ncbi:MAG: hypothetical protein AABZ60_00750, partial [Planctomycetota bacterium]
MRNRAQGMTEFILLIGLMVIAGILIAAVFGSNQKGLFQASKETLQDGREIAELSDSAASDSTKDSGAHSTGNLAGGSEKESAHLKSSTEGKAQSEKFVPPGPESKKYSQSAGNDPRKSKSSTGGFHAPESNSGQNSASNSASNSGSQGGFNASENKSSNASSGNSGGNNSASGGFSGNEGSGTGGSGNGTKNSQNPQSNEKNTGNVKTSENSKTGGFQGQENSKTT